MTFSAKGAPALAAARYHPGRDRDTTAMAKIMLVEDEDIQRRAMEAILKSGGHEVLLAGNGAQAILVAKDKNPEIVVSDLAMPKITGTELCQKMRATPGLESVYFIVVTAQEGENVKLESLLSGTDDFIRKPVQKDDLLGRVQIGLRIRKLRERNSVLSAQTSAYQKTQDTLVGALDLAIRGIEDSVMQLNASDTNQALNALRLAHEGIRNSLASVVLPEPPSRE